MIEFSDEIKFVPHEDAPIVAQAMDMGLSAESIYTSAVELVTGDPEAWTEDDEEIIRETALCNLFFFLKYVAGFSGPYSQLKENLHMEMANFYQDHRQDGEWSCGFVPRSTYKSTVWTHGVASWELLRNPNLRIGIFSCIADRALEFMHTTQRTFDSNDLMFRLFPSHCVKQKKSSRNSRWNDKIAIMPNRTRTFTEPSLKAHTAGGSTQGVHVDLALFDDIVGDAQLNSERKATADMYKLGNWFSAALRTILVSQSKSRVFLSATRYNIDDPYESVMLNTKVQEGEWSDIDTYYPIRTTGKWNCYYRSAIVGGESIFPESYSLQSLIAMSKEDFWTYITQYVNNPHAASNLEFAGYEVHPAQLVWDEYGENPTLHYRFNDEDLVEPLASCSVAIGCDPGASEHRSSSRTSRSALVVVARTTMNCVVVISTMRDYVKPSKLFDWLFFQNSKFEGYVSKTKVEAQGPFKILDDLLRREMASRDEYFLLECIPSMGDKLETIRLMLDPYLKREALFVVDESMQVFRTEFDIFPSSSMDLLDATKIAISATRLPEGAQPFDNDDESRDEFGSRRVGAAGY